MNSNGMTLAWDPELERVAAATEAMRRCIQLATALCHHSTCGGSSKLALLQSSLEQQKSLLVWKMLRHSSSVNSRGA